MTLDLSLINQIESLRIPLDDSESPLDWKDWYHYLSFYPFLDFEECRKEVKKYKIKSSAEYKQKRKPSWPSNPNNYYKEKWRGYDHFLGK